MITTGQKVVVKINGKRINCTAYPISYINPIGYWALGRGLTAAVRRAGLRVHRGWSVGIVVNTGAIEQINRDGYHGQIGQLI